MIYISPFLLDMAFIEEKVTCFFYVYRKCFHAAYYYLDDPPCQAPTGSLINWEDPVEVAGEVRSAVPVNEFSKHVAELHADGDIGFSKEYESLQNDSAVDECPSEHSQHPDNKAKNRYLNIIACEYFVSVLFRMFFLHLLMCVTYFR